MSRSRVTSAHYPRSLQRGGFGQLAVMRSPRAVLAHVIDEGLQPGMIAGVVPDR